MPREPAKQLLDFDSNFQDFSFSLSRIPLIIVHKLNPSGEVWIMRLLNARTLELHDFMDDAIPEYAILSHRWGAAKEEVSYLDMQNAVGTSKRGFEKIKHSCALACERNISWVWIDCCCIDKSSSAELSEAINSMFRWYQESKICFAYLFDVKSSTRPHSSFMASSWFRRSWTLQELLAPRKVEFYDGQWILFGTRESLAEKISTITGISQAILSEPDKSTPLALRNLSVATKMSWASQRVAARKEDLAYSLLGLFEVNMPLLYGEGERAFIRLQEEIMRNSDDHSLFAWTSSAACQRGLLAKSPSDFIRGRHIDTISKRHSPHRAPYSITNLGLSIELLMLPWAMDIYLAVLDCSNTDGLTTRIGIFLRHLDEKGQYARVVVDGQDFSLLHADLLSKGKVRKAFVQQRMWDTPIQDMLYGFRIRDLPRFVQGTSQGHQVFRAVAMKRWTNSKQILEMCSGQRGTAGVIWFKSEAGYSVLKLGFDDDFNIMAKTDGPLWSKNGFLRRTVTPTSEDIPDEETLNPNWMQMGRPDMDDVFKVTRGCGIVIKRPLANLSIHEEYVDGKKVWVVDVVQTVE